MNFVQQGPAVDASATQRGLVSLGAQTWAGVKTFSEVPKAPGFEATSTSNAVPGLKLTNTSAQFAFMTANGQWGIWQNGGQTQMLFTVGNQTLFGIYPLVPGLILNNGYYYRADAGNNTVAFLLNVAGARLKFSAIAGGTTDYLFGDGATMVKAAGKFAAVAGLGVGNSAAAAGPVGNVVKKMEVFDAAGASLGFVPIYDAIT